MANRDIQFDFEGKQYMVGPEAYKTEIIVLPDNRMIKVMNWSESEPPKPKEFFEIPGKVKTATPEDTARYFGGTVACKA